jgi:hypothetical protein
MPERHTTSKGKNKTKKGRENSYKQMTSAEIEASKKKLGLETNEAKQICNASGCQNAATIKCKYCNRSFCDHHRDPVLPISLSEKINLNDQSDPWLYKEVMRNWNREDCHPCPGYRLWWEENRGRSVGVVQYAETMQEGGKRSGKPWTAPTQAAPEPKGVPREAQSTKPQRELPVEETTLNGPAASEESMLKYALILILIGIIVVGVLYYAKLFPHSNSPVPTNFNTIATTTIQNSSQSGLHSIVIAEQGSVFPVNAYPDNYYSFNVTIPANEINITVNGGFASNKQIEIALLSPNQFASLENSSIPGFVSLYSLNSSGPALLNIILNHTGQYYLVFFTDYGAPKTIGAGPHINNLNSNTTPYTNVTITRQFTVDYRDSTTTTSTSTSTSTTTTYTSSVQTTASTSTIPSSSSTIFTTTISQTEQNNGWATQFFENISSERGSQYYYCSNLSQFAKVRFNTMVSNYGVTHYGYDQDFDNFYGTIYNTYFAEEVFYPNLGLFGDTPNAYTSQIQSTAPLHWQLITNSTYSYYGYYIANGPSYEILGPGGGYGAPCPVTELPGPNINIQQFFAQYGCSVQVSNETWFVIELASSCPCCEAWS